MKINSYLDCLLIDLENFEPETLSGIVCFVRKHGDYSTITMLARNSKRSAKYILNQCLLLIAEKNPISDIQLAGLLVIVADVDIDLYDELTLTVARHPISRDVSSTSDELSNYHWSRAMAISSLLNKEVLGETIRKSA